MFKKAKVRSILELLGKGLSAREVSRGLRVSRNTVTEVAKLFEESGKDWDEISVLDDDRLYALFYPDKFKSKPRYAPVDYACVHRELKKVGVTEKLLWEEYCAVCEKEGGSTAPTSLSPGITISTLLTVIIPATLGINPVLRWRLTGQVRQWVFSDLKPGKSQRHICLLQRFHTAR